MRVLVTGASGMLGSVVFKVLSMDPDLQVFGTVRTESLAGLMEKGFNGSQLITVDLSVENSVKYILSVDGPFGVIVNCVGVVSQVMKGIPKSRVIALNSALPHLLAEEVEKTKGRLIHISTDCVFSGNKGGYSELSIPDPVDFYGKSKMLGEIVSAPHLTIRTSIVGRQLFGRKYGLLEWFLNQTNGSIMGYKHHIWSGVTTLFLANAIKYLIKRKENVWLLHICGEVVTKYELLNFFKEIFEKNDVKIIPTEVENNELRVNRSLTSIRKIGINANDRLEVPPLREMLQQLKEFEW